MRLFFFLYWMLQRSRNNMIEMTGWKKKMEKSAAEILDVSAPSKNICFVHKVTLTGLWPGRVWSMLLRLAVEMLPSYSFCSSRSSSDSHRAAAAGAVGLHVPHHPAQHQLHRRRRTGHPAGDPVPRQPLHVDRDARRRLAHLQGVAPGAGHGVPHQRPAHPAWGGRHRGSGAAAHQQDKVCRWVGSRVPGDVSVRSGVRTSPAHFANQVGQSGRSLVCFLVVSKLFTALLLVNPAARYGLKKKGKIYGFPKKGELNWSFHKLLCIVRTSDSELNWTFCSILCNFK